MKNIASVLTGLLLTIGIVPISGAQVTELYGSDTLFEMTRYLLETYPQSCGGKEGAWDTTYIEYIGGGSGVGFGEMVARRQEIAPMSRALTVAQCIGYEASAEGLIHSLGGVGLYRAVETLANEDADCTGGGEAACEGVSAAGTMTVHDINGIAGLDCPGCEGTIYTFETWRDVLALAYFGRHKDGSFDCGSDVRYALAGLPTATPLGGREDTPLDCTQDCWEHFFDNAPDAACTDENCNVNWHLWRKGDATGTTEAVRGFLGIPGSAPFCNGDDRSDNDPIRRPVHPKEDLPGRKDMPLRISTLDDDCTGNGGTMVTTLTDTATMGWLLPVVVPPAFVKNTDVCAQGSFDWKPQPFKYRPLCEDGGGSAFAQCLAPKDQNGDHGCINTANNPSFSTPIGADTRAHNWVQRLADGSIVLDALRRETAAAYYNIHAAHAVSQDGPLCNHASSSRQIACLAAASPCSVGYGDVGAGSAVPASQSLKINGIAADAMSLRGFTYPLTQYQYLTALAGFDGISNPEQAALAACYMDRAKVDSAATASGIVPLSDIHTGSVPPVDICP